jgi:hypothetical protein
MSDQIELNFDKPVFLQGEMPTPSKLNLIADKFQTATDILLKATGNTFLRNIANIAAVLGDTNLLSNPGSIVPAVPPIFQTGNKLINRIPVTVTGLATPYTLNMDPTLYELNGEDVVVGGKVINVVIASVLNSTGNIFRVYSGTLTPPTGTVDGASIYSVTFATDDADFSTDISNIGNSGTNYTIVLLTVNQRVIDTLVQALVNIGSISFPSAEGNIADTSGTINTYSTPRSITDELTFIENKYFYTYWKIVVTKSDGVVPTPAWIGTDPTGGWSTAWNSSVWTSSPNPTLISELISKGAIFPSVQKSTTTCYCFNASEIAQELSAPNVLRARVYVNGGIPLMRTNGLQVLACFEPVGHNGLPTVYISDDDSLHTDGTDEYTIMVPVAIPFRLLRADDFIVTGTTTLWPSVMEKVIGTGYSEEPYPEDISYRLDRCETNIGILEAAISGLTTTTVVLG